MRAVTLAAAVLALTAPVANATLVFNEGADTSPATVWSAADDGSGAKRIARGGLNPRISPDGAKVAFQTVYGAPGSRPRGAPTRRRGRRTRATSPRSRAPRSARSAWCWST